MHDYIPRTPFQDYLTWQRSRVPPFDSGFAPFHSSTHAPGVHFEWIQPNSVSINWSFPTTTGRNAIDAPKLRSCHTFMSTLPQSCRCRYRCNPLPWSNLMAGSTEAHHPCRTYGDLVGLHSWNPAEFLSVCWLWSQNFMAINPQILNCKVMVLS